MRIFVDTEFTSFSDPRLISVGAVIDQSRFFYGIFTDFPRSACTEFVRDEILPILDANHPACTGSHDQVAGALLEWIVEMSGADSECEIVADDECDIELLRRLNAATRFYRRQVRFRYTLCPLAGNDEAERTYARFFEENPSRRRHNALDDALAYWTALLTGR